MQWGNTLLYCMDVYSLYGKRCRNTLSCLDQYTIQRISIVKWTQMCTISSECQTHCQGLSELLRDTLRPTISVEYVMDSHAYVKQKQMVKRPGPVMDSRAKKGLSSESIAEKLMLKNFWVEFSGENYRKMHTHAIQVAFIWTCIFYISLLTQWCIYASVNQALFGTKNCSLPDQYQAIIWTNAGLLSNEHL